MAERETASFRWNVLAFAIMVAVVLITSTALLVLLDPRSQVWWGDRFSDLGRSVRAILDTFLPR